MTKEEFKLLSEMEKVKYLVDNDIITIEGIRQWAREDTPNLVLTDMWDGDD